MADTVRTTPNIDKNETTSTADSSLDPISVETLKNGIQELSANQNSFIEIKKHIAKVVEALAQNSSFFSRIATTWADMPLWLKIVLGFAVVVPTLVLGIVFQVITLIVFSLLSIASYLGIAYLLNNHNEHTHDITDKLQETMNTLADSLEEAIQSLEPLRKELAEQVNYFHDENERLLSSDEELRHKISQLTEEGRRLQEDSESLKSVNFQLKGTNTKLESSNELQKELLRINVQEIERLNKESEKNAFALVQATQELERVQKEMGERLRQSQLIAEVLQQNAIEFSNQVIESKEERELFQTKLKGFVSNQAESFNRITDRIFQAETELARVKEELNFSNKRNEELLDRMDRVLIPWENRLNLITPPPTVKHSKTISEIGLMGHKENINPTKVSSEQHLIEVRI
ncbi:LegC2/C7 family Dot/Icm T4SS effector [Legionella waltersii]|uniref:Microtubule binding protein n=1 Tax=Legionella waltersii TaxID=66969 RepID=A0A0W1A1M4_9GAMM|nr:LegC2/C7 family Dot/Icm T4SS effector [Legionella waltersii]KTD75282.1 microtubule binding protein [Legionella waltersii]SNV06907.1 microtubule binding protein, putative [Legionella waltersii]